MALHAVKTSLELDHLVIRMMLLKLAKAPYTYKACMWF